MTWLLDAMRALRKDVTAPAVSIALVLSATGLSSFVFFYVAWRGAARTPIVPFQVPFLVSGGLGGLALLVFALGLLDVHAGRVEAAHRRADADVVLREAVELLALAPAARRRRSATRPSGADRG
ncbi:MAG TPA: hypothetical protein VNA14_13510 [Mycobacteriales bacterium]|nr:hypothetical protein [Mycobacteriales bacterium]